MKNKILLFTTVAFVAFGLGYFRIPFGSGRGLSSIEEAPSAIIPSVNNYKNLPCPSEQEYRQLAKEVHLKVPEGIDICKDEIHGPLAKIMSFAKKLKFQFPKNFSPELQNDLRDPLAYVARMVPLVDFNMKQIDSVAYFCNGGRMCPVPGMYLGGSFVDEEPLMGLAVLFHEARHASPNDPSHKNCLRGDIPKTPGGCDQRLSVSESDAGAYSYDSVFTAALGLYAEGLSEADREFSLSHSYHRVGTRFNEVPEELAQLLDMVAVLDESGSVYLLHPYYKEPIPLSLPFLNAGEVVERIETYIATNGLAFFTSQHRLFSWNARDGFKRSYKDSVPESAQILEFSRMMDGTKNEYAYPTFLLPENSLRQIQFKPDGKLPEFASYYISTYRKVELVIPEFWRFFIALFRENIFIDKQGVLYKTSPYSHEQQFIPREDLQIPGQTWVHGSGGVLFDTLYGVSNTGALYQVEEIVTELPQNPESLEEDPGQEISYKMSLTSFQVPKGKKAKKIIEGLNIRALLDEDGALYFESYDKTLRSRWSADHLKVKDAAIFSKTLTTPKLFALAGDRKKFEETCKIREMLFDPWFDKGMGIDQNGFLVIAGSKESCLRIRQRNYRQAKIKFFAMDKKTLLEDERTKDLIHRYAQNGLELVDENGRIELLRPYDYP